MPTTGKSAWSAAWRESDSPMAPKSIPWLLAIVATSTPAASSARKALAGARKVKLLLCAVPRVVIAVSRLTMARSARRSTDAIGPKVVSGFVVRRPRITPSECRSPPTLSPHRAWPRFGAERWWSARSCSRTGPPRASGWACRRSTCRYRMPRAQPPAPARWRWGERRIRTDVTRRLRSGDGGCRADSLPCSVPPCQVCAQIVRKSPNRRDRHGHANRPRAREWVAMPRAQRAARSLPRARVGGPDSAGGADVAAGLVAGGPGWADDLAEELVGRVGEGG